MFLGIRRTLATLATAFVLVAAAGAQPAAPATTTPAPNAPPIARTFQDLARQLAKARLEVWKKSPATADLSSYLSLLDRGAEARAAFTEQFLDSDNSMLRQVAMAQRLRDSKDPAHARELIREAARSGGVIPILHDLEGQVRELDVETQNLYKRTRFNSEAIERLIDSIPSCLGRNPEGDVNSGEVPFATIIELARLRVSGERSTSATLFAALDAAAAVPGVGRHGSIRLVAAFSPPTAIAYARSRPLTDIDRRSIPILLRACAEAADLPTAAELLFLSDIRTNTRTFDMALARLLLDAREPDLAWDLLSVANRGKKVENWDDEAVLVACLAHVLGARQALDYVTRAELYRIALMRETASSCQPTIWPLVRYEIDRKRDSRVKIPSNKVGEFVASGDALMVHDWRHLQESRRFYELTKGLPPEALAPVVGGNVEDELPLPLRVR